MPRGGSPGYSTGFKEGNLAKRRGAGWTPAQQKRNSDKAKEAKDGREIARKLVSDKRYLTSLRKRLREGTAGPIENLLWMLAYGKPKEQHDGEDIQARIIEVREAAREAILKAKPQFRLPPNVVAIEKGKADEDGGE